MEGKRRARSGADSVCRPRSPGVTRAQTLCLPAPSVFRVLERSSCHVAAIFKVVSPETEQEFWLLSEPLGYVATWWICSRCLPSCTEREVGKSEGKIAQNWTCLVAPERHNCAPPLGKDDVTIGALWLPAEKCLGKIREEGRTLNKFRKRILKLTAIKQEGTKIYNHIPFCRNLQPLTSIISKLVSICRTKKTTVLGTVPRGW